jgi:hypothetical protein
LECRWGRAGYLGVAGSFAALKMTPEKQIDNDKNKTKDKNTGKVNDPTQAEGGLE